MNTTRGFFLLLGITEIFFALFAMTEPLGYAQYGYLVSLLWDFPAFLVVMAVCSLVSTLIFYTRKTYRINTILSSFLTAQWLMVIVAAFVLQFFTIALPLFIYMFVMRLIMTIQFEILLRGNNGIRV